MTAPRRNTRPQPAGSCAAILIQGQDRHTCRKPALHQGCCDWPTARHPEPARRPAPPTRRAPAALTDVQLADAQAIWAKTARRIEQAALAASAGLRR